MIVESFSDISDPSFERIKSLVATHSGIHLGHTKKQLVVSRLSKRLRHLNVPDFDGYYDICTRSPEELQTMINILTTNETSFFREMNHFDFLRRSILPSFKGEIFRVWSAASSIGAEGYSLAMVLDDALLHTPKEWEVIGTDINTEVVEQASKGIYPLRFADQIDKRYLKRYCLKGVNSKEGYFAIGERLKKRTIFKCANLMSPIGDSIGVFEVIFLRNMLIYFNDENKKKIVSNVSKSLKEGGFLFVGHAETITGMLPCLHQVRPTVYIKKGSRC